MATGPLGALLLLLLLLLGCVVVADEDLSLPLKSYVNYPDDIFSWNVSSEVKHFSEGYTMYNVFMVSQRWLTPSDSSTPIYQHWLQVCVPDVLVDSTFAYLWIDGYDNSPFNSPPSSLDDTLYIPCLQSNTLTFGLYQIPNAPVYFQGDYMHKRRVEDAIVAYTWAHYLNNSMDTDWIAEFPMAKAGVKALDAAQQFWDTIRGNLPGLERFAVAGASKRGWTTWLVGAMGDPRIVSIIPVVAPVGNLIPQMNEQWQAYGNWSFVLQAYLTEGIMGWLNTPEFYRLTKMIDPLSFQNEMARLVKYEIGATNDEFFMPDALKYFWDELPGPKLWRIIPNCDHTIAGHAKEALESVSTFLQAFKTSGSNITLPEYSWIVSEDARTIVVSASLVGLVKVQVWTSLNKPNRDWRAVRCEDERPHCLNPEAEFFPHENVTILAPGVFSHTVDVPKKGHYSAFFLELHYELIPGAKPIVVTSTVAISPTTLPYPPCPPSECACKWNCAPQ